MIQQTYRQICRYCEAFRDLNEAGQWGPWHPKQRPLHPDETRQTAELTTCDACRRHGQPRRPS